MTTCNPVKRNPAFNVELRPLVAKTCPVCGVLKDASGFYRDPKGRYETRCLECNRERCVKRKRRPEVRERELERDREYNRNRRSEESKERHREARRAYRERNREYLRQHGAEYRKRMYSDIPRPHNGPWTATEDAIVSRQDITLIEMCYMLGRSYGSVQSRRGALRKQGVIL